MKYLVWLALLLPMVASAQEETAMEETPPAAPTVSPCDSENHRQFDFWIGEWEVSSNGQPAGTNSIQSILGGCALQENWRGAGPGGLTGTSFNIYDRANTFTANGRWTSRSTAR